MFTTRQLKGTKDQISQQIMQIDGQVVAAVVLIKTPEAAARLTDEEFARMMAELEAMAVSAPHADDSRDAIYTRMPGE